MPSLTFSLPRRLMRPFQHMALLLVVSVAMSGAQAQIQRIGSPSPSTANFFGGAVSLDGTRLLIGASGESTCGANGGAAYLYMPDHNDRYNEVARLAPEDCKPGRFIGHAVALSESRALVAGARTAVGEAEPNPVYLFEEIRTGLWEEAAQLYPNDSKNVLGFGASIDIDGDWAAVSASGDERNGQPGAVYLFYHDSSNGLWAVSQKLEGPEGFGEQVVLKGNRMAISAPSERAAATGGVYVFELDDTGQWREADRIGGFSEDRIRIDIQESELVVGRAEAESRQRGRVDVYVRNGEGIWGHAHTLYPRSSYDYGSFGTDVSISGRRLLVAGFTEQINLSYNIDRVVYVFGQTPDGDWRQQHIIDLGNTGFAADIDLDGKTALIGEADDESAGSAYVVRIF